MFIKSKRLKRLAQKNNKAFWKGGTLVKKTKRFHFVFGWIETSAKTYFIYILYSSILEWGEQNDIKGNRSGKRLLGELKHNYFVVCFREFFVDQRNKSLALETSFVGTFCLVRKISDFVWQVMKTIS